MHPTNLLKKPQADDAAGLDVFPKRRIVIHYAGTQAKIWVLVAMSMGIALLAVLSLWLELPDIAKDAAMSRAGKSVVEQAARVDGQCKRMKFIFVDCDAKITYRPDPAVAHEETIEQSFMFVGTDYNTTVDVLRSTVYPDRVTTTLATEHLGNRIATMLALFLLFAGIAVAGFRDAWIGSQRRKLEGKAMVVRPLLVSITKTDEHNHVSFTATIDGREVKTSNRMREGDSPLYVGNQGLALAVALPNSPFLILLDHDMTALAFTDLERAQIRAALG
ncbi:MAG TPA: hypothetical protein VFS95_14875 [Telluria sp.]|nr:hypothetical protein [Telluria sp.]